MGTDVLVAQSRKPPMHSISLPIVRRSLAKLNTFAFQEMIGVNSPISIIAFRSTAGVRTPGSRTISGDF